MPTLQPQALARRLSQPADKPLLLHVGFKKLYQLPAKFMIDRKGRMVGRTDAQDIAELTRQLDELLAE
jgi:hypothetical protein